MSNELVQIKLHLLFLEGRLCMRKIILIVITLLLCACGQGSDVVFETNETEPKHLGTTFVYYEHFTDKGDGFYLYDLYQLVYVDSNYNSIPLSYLSFADDKEVNLLEDYQFDKYYDAFFFGSSVQQFGDSLYFLSEGQDIEQNVGYYLNQVDLKGENRKQLLSLTFVPYLFILHQDRLIITENNMNGLILHIYDNQLKEIETLEVDGSVSRLHAYDEYVYMTVDNHGSSAIKRLDLRDFSITNVHDNDSLLFVNGDKFGTYNVSKKANEVDDLSEIYTITKIFDLETNKLLSETHDEMIGYFDDECVYVASLKEEEMKYIKYDYEYNIIQEITPSDFMTSSRLLVTIFISQDFYHIIRVIDDSIISKGFIDGKMSYFNCSFEVNDCEVFYQDNNSVD